MGRRKWPRVVAPPPPKRKPPNATVTFAMANGQTRVLEFDSLTIDYQPESLETHSFDGGVQWHPTGFLDMRLRGRIHVPEKS